MAVKSIQMYRRNLDGTETNLNPLTESQYVLMENGQTVQEVLSDRDSDKYTPVITNSSSTFKVGQGDNVDLSSSMKEGAYDSCVLKGKTMVNCIQEPSSQDIVLPYEFEDGQYVTINDTKESGALGIELKGQTLVNLVPKMNNSGNESSLVYITEDEIKISEDSTAHRQMYWTSNEVLSKFKTNTTYTVIANITENTLTSAFMLINAYAAVGGDIASAALCVPVNFTGRFVGVFRTVSDFTNRTRLGFNAGAGSEGKLTMKNDMVILEGDWTNQELPFDSFFTGMASCKMPTLHSCQQLFDYNAITKPSISGDIGFVKNESSIKVSFSNTNRDVHQNTSILIPAGTYKVSYMVRGKIESVGDTSTINASKVGIAFSIDKAWSSGGAKRLEYQFVNLSETEFTYRSTTFTFDEPQYVTIFYHGWNNNPVGWCEFKDVRITQQGKSSILSLPEEVVLRSLPNGVCDTFNTRTGEYVQRIGERILDGSESQWIHGSISPTNVFELPMTNMKRYTGVGQIICNTLPYSYTNLEVWDTYTGVSPLSARGNIVLRNNNTDTIQDLKAWLSQNPTTICYELKTPIVTKINLPSTLKSWSTTTHIYSEIPENSLYPVLSHSNLTYPVILKPSTKYSIVANSYSNNHTNSAINFNLGGATASTTVGNRVTTITTLSTLSNELLTMSGRGNKLNNVMVIEGDVVGDEPYFEGICDCKSPVLSNVGKNLCGGMELGSLNTGEGLPEASSTRIRTIDYIPLKQNYYTISTETSTVVGRRYYDENKKFIINKTVNTSQTPVTVLDAPSNAKFLKLTVVDVTDINYKIYVTNETHKQGEYEPYKSNILSIPTYYDEESDSDKTIVLRSLPNGVCDTLNVETGEYVQRIGEVVLNGSENWGNAPSYINGNPRFCYDCSNLKVRNNVGNQLVLTNSDTIISVPSDVPKSATKGVFHHNTVAQIHIFIPSSEIGGTTPSNFKTYLQQNPVTVQYELATPIVSTIDVQGFPYAYTNGHVQLSSGSIEQSLTPKVEYSLSANKTGQINSNTKRVSAHQKQLDDFEAMMLTSMVQSAYDKAILQFDYEMQMMSLGGE